MKKKFTWFIALLLLGAISTGHSQSVTPFIINAGGGWGTVNGYVFEYNIGEMVAVATLSTPNVIVTQGLLQPVDDKAIAPLPVTLIRFTGVKKNGYNQLDWATAAETGQTIFELQRSNDGIGFSTIYTMPARNLTTGSSYTYNDHSPFNQKVFYRLKIAESGAAVRYSVIVLLTTTTSSNWTVFPNPAKSGSNLYINLQNSDNVKTAMLVITDAAGRIVQSRNLTLSNGNQTHTVTAPLAAGTYFLTLTGFTAIQNQKIIIH